MLENIKIDRLVYEPVYRQIACKLREQILSGNLPDGTKLPPEPEMAEIFCANRLTLRKSLKLLGRQRLVIQKKGRGTFVTYGPRKKYRIGLTYSPEGARESSFGLQVLNGVISAMQKNCCGELVFLSSEYDKKTPIIQTYNELNCDGLIIIGINNKDIEEICSAAFDKIPTVILCADKKGYEESERVWINVTEGAMRMAVEHFVQLGHRKILFLSTVPSTPVLEMRNKEYLQAINALGIADTSEMVQIKDVEMWYDGARDFMREKCKVKERPTAVLCSGETFTYGAWQGIMDSGLRIPEDISIIGTGCSGKVNPHLSTLKVDVFGMAKLAGETIMDLLEHRSLEKKNIYFDSILIDRGSCRKL